LPLDGAEDEESLPAGFTPLPPLPEQDASADDQPGDGQSTQDDANDEASASTPAGDDDAGSGPNRR